VPLLAVVDQVVKQFSGRHTTRPVEVHISGEPPSANAETTYVQQVLVNLISNADKYSDAGLPIDIELSSEDGGAVVRVLDRGPGVGPEELNQIFDRFYRSQRTAGQATGKGLGLTVCKRLIEAMAGRIWAKPREGGGLEVGFSLPLAAPEAPVQVAAAESQT
jgi:K+-sensing histidine kinase KdpD